MTGYGRTTTQNRLRLHGAQMFWPTQQIRFQFRWNRANAPLDLKESYSPGRSF